MARKSIDENAPLKEMFSRAKAPAANDPNAERPSKDKKIQQALRLIAEIISDLDDNEGDKTGHDHPHKTEHCAFCSGPKALPRRLLVPAAKRATDINPVNAPAYWRKSASDLGFDPQPQYIAALTSKYWGPKPRQLSVSFLDSPGSDLRNRIISHMNAWAKAGCISFAETQGTGDVRISRAQGGYWSYLGTDILHIPANRPTMNLEGFTMTTPESEYRRVVRHETGHTLGFPHEHMRRDIIARIDPEKVYAYAAQFYGWDRPTVDAQILTPLEERQLLRGSTAADQTSIMCYQLPGSITYDGLPIIGGSDINSSDYEFCALIYPKPSSVVPVAANSDDWSPEEDVA